MPILVSHEVPAVEIVQLFISGWSSVDLFVKNPYLFFPPANHWSKGSGVDAFTMGFLYNEVFFDIGKVFPGIPTIN